MAPDPTPTSAPGDGHPVREEAEDIEPALYRLLEQRYAGFKLVHGKRDETEDPEHRSEPRPPV